MIDTSPSCTDAFLYISKDPIWFDWLQTFFSAKFASAKILVYILTLNDRKQNKIGF